MSKSICFDVLGTCFDFTHAITTIQSRLGSILADGHVDAKTLFFSWFYAAQRDFTYCSMIGEYKPIAEILKGTLRRACAIVDLEIGRIEEGDVDAIMQSIKTLTPRSHLKPLFDNLRATGWDVYAVTNGGSETSLAYYKNANIELDPTHLLSCDTIKLAKPALGVYEVARKQVIEAGCDGSQRWFAAAHSWDLIAARKAGFKTAWVGFEEREACTDIFGGFDLECEDFEELLKRLEEL